MSNAAFPTIGDIAEKTDKLPENIDPTAAIDDADDDGPALVEVIESMCMSCGGNGITRMLLTSIPYFREIIIMSFECNDCGVKNNETQAAGRIQDLGIKYKCEIVRQGDLNRQLVKSPSCTVHFPDFDFTIPPGRGQLTTIEGIMRDVVRDLLINQPLRKHADPTTYEAVEKIIERFQIIVPEDQDPNIKPEAPLPTRLTIEVDDPAGNSFVEFYGSTADPQWHMNQYHRTAEQNGSLGLAADATAAPEQQLALSATADAAETDGAPSADEVLVFPGPCPSCTLKVETRMKKVTIPYFKDIFIMSTNCDACGYKDNEVKSGAAVSEKGKRITLKVVDEEDLSRDILKSETCGFSVPEIELVLEAGTLGGRFTTLEGILDQIYEELSSKVFSSEDAVDTSSSVKPFLKKLQNLKLLKDHFTVILDDPLSNSYLQNLYAPDPDPNMEVEVYDRTFEQNDELGLNDMKVEGYENDNPTP